MDLVRDPEGIEIEVLNRTGAIDGRNVLEIGCGDGRLIWRYADVATSAVGVDLDAESVAVAATMRPEAVKTPATFMLAGAETLPFSDAAFECVILGWSL